MKDDTSDTSDEIVEIIDLTGEDRPVTQLQTEEVIDLTEDFWIIKHKNQENTPIRRNNSDMQTTSLYKHKNIDTVDLVGDYTILNERCLNGVSTSSYSSNLSRKSGTESLKSNISKPIKQDYLFASLTTPEDPSVCEQRYEASSVVAAPAQSASASALASKENVFPIFRSKREEQAGTMGGIRLDQKASPLENVNAASSILLADTSSTATIKAERNKDAIEYQRNRVHNTRKNSPPPEIREVVPEHNHPAINREKIVASKLSGTESKQLSRPVLERAPSLPVQIKDEKHMMGSRNMSQCREHIGRFLTKINTKNSHKKPAQTVVQSGEKSLKPMEQRNELSSFNQLETMLLNKERLVVMPEFLYQGVLELCRLDSDRALRLIQDALKADNLTLYLFLINAQAITNKMDDYERSDSSSGQPLGHWRDLINCLQKCSFFVDSGSKANRKSINQCIQILRIWNDFLVVGLLHDESEWDIGALLSIWMTAFLAFDDSEATFEGSISFLEILSTFLGNAFRRRHMFFANHVASGAVISDAGSPVDMSGVYKAVLHIIDPSTRADKEENSKESVKKGKPGKKPRTGTSASSVAGFHGSSSSSSNLSEAYFNYQHLFGDTKVFKWDPLIALKMLKMVTNDLIPDKEFALFLLKAIVDVLTGFDDSSSHSDSNADSKWTDLCAFIFDDRVSDLCKFVLSGGLVSGSSAAQKKPGEGDEKSPLAELKFIVSG